VGKHPPVSEGPTLDRAIVSVPGLKMNSYHADEPRISEVERGRSCKAIVHVPSGKALTAGDSVRFALSYTHAYQEPCFVKGGDSVRVLLTEVTDLGGDRSRHRRGSFSTRLGAARSERTTRHHCQAGGEASLARITQIAHRFRHGNYARTLRIPGFPNYWVRYSPGLGKQARSRSRVRTTQKRRPPDILAVLQVFCLESEDLLRCSSYGNCRANSATRHWPASTAPSGPLKGSQMETSMRCVLRSVAVLSLLICAQGEVVADPVQPGDFLTANFLGGGSITRVDPGGCPGHS
jgi:hypothetical protein